ncbi:uncharacterized protein BDR25DRAFT_378528 [Lindgomyces ingoldianus]|uniref:Uncharacterized protein n=1 Tax=Lindgomyces ingoldianus TaxID=673940 RepID=A0ACB6QG00_9PLEO|nr:uncharacterized protein BDR25DRAFT_378528 [Lindgomyces ingoldianus]KAF2465821.1 hypothetical protein BDR25DRAFT_378528 [Lindgomyces ingoldianus]
MASVVSPRNLILKNLRKQVEKDGAATAGTSDDRDTLPLPALGDMQLHSFFKPSLEAGTYSIEVNQDIDITYNEKDKETNLPIISHQALPLGLKGEATAIQTFEVVAPRFAIDLKDIHSTYPPQGHADQPNVLPHIVFSDAHLPWERSTPGISETSSDPKEDAIPWLAVFPFDCSGTTPETQELRLTPEQLNGDYAIYQKIGGDGKLVEIKQSSTFTISMTVAEYLALKTRSPPPVTPTPETNSPPNPSPNTPDARPTLDPKKFTKLRIPPFEKDPDYSEISSLDTPVEVIFLSGKLFRQLFPLNASKLPDVTPFRFLSHVRNVNTQGMAQASVEDGETGLFSILHSKRTGPTDIAQNTPPRPQVVHLISLEYIDQMTGVDAMKDDELVAFVSLYRWNYLCQPPLTVNFVDAMRDIGESMQDTKEQVANNLLRCPENVLTQMRVKAAIAAKGTGSLKQEKVTELQSAMLERLSNGYSLVRHRTASGEETVAFNRGPLIPTSPAQLQPKWPYGSNFGQDYQIFDRNLGMMDISYSSAWQIGKLLATSDLGFVAALLRVRSMAHKAGVKESQVMAASMIFGMKGKLAVFNDLQNSASMLNEVSNTPSGAAATPDLRQRWSHTTPIPEETKASAKLPSNTNVKNAFISGVHRQMVSISAIAGTEDVIFDELALAASTDWAYVHSWIMDRLFLSGLPTHYYIGDSSFLPPESIRFFQIDTNWMDCFIDGALSVANHMARDDDHIRDAIKNQLNKFFSTKYTNNNDQPLHYPQVPRYGFFLRSAVVAIFQDLTVDIPYPDAPEDKTQNGRLPILLQKHLGKDILMVLLDRAPEDIVTIKLSQPPHQQRFSAGDALDHNSIEFLFRKLYRSTQGGFFHEFGDPHKLFRPGYVPPIHSDTPGHVEADEDITTEPLYDWTTRCLDLPTLEKYLLGENGVYTKGMPAEWGPDGDGRLHKLSSAMTGLILNDTMKYLEIKGLNYDKKRKTLQEPYSLRVKPTLASINVVSKKIQSIKTTLASKSSLLDNVSRDPLQKVPQNPSNVSPSSSLRANALAHPTTPAHLTRLAPLMGSVPITTKATVAGPAATAPPPANVNAIAHDRSFKYAIFPATSKYIAPLPALPSSNSYVFVDAPFVPDLIFSININPIATNQIEVIENGKKIKKSLWLREVQFKIPVGDPARRKGDADIQGLGLVPDNASAGLQGRMLDNQRWVIHLDPGAEYMVVRVIPRSTKMSTPVEWNRNLSFKLMEVDIAGFDVPGVGEKVQIGEVKPPTGPVEVRVSEVYGFLLPDGKTWVDQGRASWSWKVQRKVGFASGWRPEGPK